MTEESVGIPGQEPLSVAEAGSRPAPLGFWASCTGCHELNDGYPTGPWSVKYECNLGLGCDECCGVGAVWDDTDYNAMVDFILALDAARPAPTAGKSPGLTTKESTL